MTTAAEMSVLNRSGSSLPGLSSNHPSGDALVAQRQAEPRQWAVYLHERGKRPRLVDVQVPDRFPGEITVDDKTYHWVGADLNERTLTYSNFKPGSQ